MSKRLRALLAATGVLAGLSGLVLLNADTPRTNLGKRVGDFRLKDTRGRVVSLGDFKDKKAVAVVFIGTECPISNAFMPRLAELHKEYESQGVQFLAINSNCQDRPADVARHAKEHHLRFPVLKDVGNRVADVFGARRTPEVFLLDGRRAICYQGRIDDQFGVGYKRPRPTRRDLAEAIHDVLAGKSVRQPTTGIAGCAIARLPKPKQDGPVTYAKNIARILQKNCQECHRPGQIGPMPLLTYDDAVAWAETISEVVRDSRMPPWPADPRYGKFANDRRLTPRERRLLLRWLDEGTPRGDDQDLPPPRKFVAGWTIGKPDLVVTMPRAYDVAAEMPAAGVPYQYVHVDPGFKEDRWVVRAEAKPGAASVVHHLIVFVQPPGTTFFPGGPETPALAGMAPGDMPLVLTEGTAKKVPAGSKLVFQVHYTPNGTAEKDRSSVGLIFAKKPPRHEMLVEPIANVAIKIPPGAGNYEAKAGFAFRRDGHISGFMPHMHLRGKDFRFEAIYPDGKTAVLLSVPRFNFNWQSAYRLAKPLPMPRGTRIRCTAHFDNSARNPNNPDATKEVRWGEQTWEEMMIGWMDYYYDSKAQ
ncbi:MAG TPA: redoxin domain-containing protein [Gemmataceae bacterium]|jgi:peroxiredoxin/mono/diheme cytochrome c family protein|nr:redoxin domain-containing protein [Gemmataceae bacterium]